MMKTLAEHPTTEIESLIAEVAEQFTQEIHQGRIPSIDDYARRHPEISHVIRQVFPALAVLGEAAPLNPSPPSAGEGLGEGAAHPASNTLGDFRILRELGRGGMGVVYEAEQISLGRRVALKVLPFAAMLDKQQLTRFKNEARAAATLVHPNIVAIYSVGVERGVHYYAMQLVEGQSLAQVVEQLKKGTEDRGQETESPPPPSAGEGLGEGDAPGKDAALADTQPVARLSTIPDPNSREYYRTVAQFGIQAAEALDYAHQNGILHRDIKPANLLVDDSGKLWVTDFGLARIEADAGMTMTGDLLGTLRYMSPEQALGKRAVIDHRSDIYSLGVTLYELLTLRAAFARDDRQELLHKIASEEPAKPRQINPQIPRDLETIVLKAIEKEPVDRYAAVADLSKDLQRFLHGTLIHARRPSVPQIARKWIHRHRALSTSILVSLVLCSIAAVGSLLYAYRAEVRRLRDVAAVESRRAKERELAYRHALYASDLSLAQNAWRIGEPVRMQEILLHHQPRNQSPDIRGWEWHYLWRQAVLPQRALLNSWRAHEGAIYFATLSPNSDLLATVSQDGTAKIWDFATRKLLTTFREHDGEVNSIAFAPDGTGVVTAGDDGTLRFWDSLTGEEHRVIQAFSGLGPHGFHDIGNHVAYSRDGHILAAASRVETKIFDVRSRKLLKTLPGDNPQFSPDGKFLVTLEEGSAGQGRVRLWSLPALEPYGEPWSTDELRNATFSPDSRLLVICQRGGMLRTLDLSGSERHEFRAFAPEAVWASFSPDGATLAVASHKGQVRLFDPYTGEPLSSTLQHGSRAYCVFFSNVGDGLFTFGSDPYVRQWNVPTLLDTRRSATIGNDESLAVSYTPDGNIVAIDSTGGHAIDAGTWGKLGTFPCECAPTSLALSTDARWLACGDRAIVSIWDRSTNKKIASVTTGFDLPVLFRHHLAFAPDGQTLAIAADRQVLLIDPATGNRIGSIRPPKYKNHICAVEYSQDGKLLVFGDTDGNIWTYDALRRQWLHEFHAPFRQITDLALTPQADVLVAASELGVVSVWSLKYDREKFSLSGHIGPVEAVAVSPDGRSLASTGADGTLRFWSLATGREQLSLPIPQPARLYDVTFSPDGKRLLACGISKGEPTIFEWCAE